MGSQPDFNRTDPWQIAQRFLDQANKSKDNERFYEHQRQTAAEKRAFDEQYANDYPRRAYEKERAIGKANLENERDLEAAGLGKGGRYRSGAAGQPGDPKFFGEFMGTLKANGITNPIALAAIAGTGQQESGWSRVYDEWDDPSASGKPGRSGLAMSWREERLRAARQYARSVGDDPNKPSAKTQAEYFIRENGYTNNPGLVEKLQNAKDLPTAMKEINKAWAFGDASHGARFGNASNFLKTFGSATLTAKERQAGLTSPPAEPAYKYDPDGREFKEVFMDADAIKKVRSGLPQAQRNLMVPDMTTVDHKGSMNVKIYTGRMGNTPAANPTVNATTPVTIPDPSKQFVATPTAETSKANGFDPESEDFFS